ncbi:MAG: bifunctional demethylmenaquinone methyltransferase/2-methoxy-6-polyprenyl-1,4-benzoquinol methylase UbiE [Bacteroidetes bacterium]|nr:bifunctional demethylmenaquinone methyltransferase/2-methoxy-6-polyprenyl-1,4-benzoquinol methylase UbiE [Bacteroidota bacterium]
MTKVVTPYKVSSDSKKEQVATMFNNIAPKYDFLNHFLSLGIDILWRKRAIRQLQALQPKLILDIATGTGDFAIEALSLHPDKIIGIDISEGMLEFGREKMIQKKLSHIIDLQSGDSENLKFEKHYFDAATVAFGVRNFEHLEKGLVEINRVLKPGGVLVVLEFSKPRNFPVKQFYSFYSKQVLPRIGKLFSKDNSAYTYLPESVQAFPDGADFVAILKKCGFLEAKAISLSFGIASIYVAKK